MFSETRSFMVFLGCLDRFQLSLLTMLWSISDLVYFGSEVYQVHHLRIVLEMFRRKRLYVKICSAYFGYLL